MIMKREDETRGNEMNGQDDSGIEWNGWVNRRKVACVNEVRQENITG